MIYIYIKYIYILFDQYDQIIYIYSDRTNILDLESLYLLIFSVFKYLKLCLKTIPQSKIINGLYE